MGLQIDLLTVRRREVVRGGTVTIEVVELPLVQCPLCGARLEEKQ